VLIGDRDKIYDNFKYNRQIYQDFHPYIKNLSYFCGKFFKVK